MMSGMDNPGHRPGAEGQPGGLPLTRGIRTTYLDKGGSWGEKATVIHLLVAVRTATAGTGWRPGQILGVG